MSSQDGGGSGALGKTLLGTGGGLGGGALLVFLLMNGGIIGTANGSEEKMVGHIADKSIHASSSQREHELDRAFGQVLDKLKDIKETQTRQDRELEKQGDDIHEMNNMISRMSGETGVDLRR